jgi:malate dehydrogenase (oxaloacetate-decarboxylating)
VDVVRPVSVRVARCVVQAAVKGGVAMQEGIPSEEGELDEWIRQQMWEAEYREMRLVGK